MRPPSHPETVDLWEFRPSAGAEPIPGYRLTRLLGRGGFGEVWECEAPGGLRKAVKFVLDDQADHADNRHSTFRQEFDAIQRVKDIRHPFLLTLERVEVAADHLVMVMELADRNLADRYDECRQAGLPGIPRAELLGYLADAAEVLDVIAARHGLQHLDVKPANLFVVAGRAKLGDYGLVARQSADGTPRAVGFTPRYAAPEVGRGHVHPRSDQYSLALVYAELLTGKLPFADKSAQQVLLMHATADPDLSPLPPADRPAARRALAKDPDERWPSCLGFVRALAAAGPPAEPDPPPAVAAPPLARWRTPSTARTVAVKMPPPRERPPEAVAAVAGVVPATGRPTAAGFGLALFATACGTGPRPQAATDPVRRPDGRWVCRFPARWPVADALRLLAAVRAQWGGRLTPAPPEGVVLRRPVRPDPDAADADPAGLEVYVRLSDPEKGGDVRVVGRVLGRPAAEVQRAADAVLPRILADVRARLQNLPDHRRSPRVPFAGPVVLLPPGGGPGVPGRCLDVSPGGLRCLADRPVGGAEVYAEFPGVPAVSGWAVRVQLTRHDPTPDGVLVAGRFRADLDDPPG